MPDGAHTLMRVLEGQNVDSDEVQAAVAWKQENPKEFEDLAAWHKQLKAEYDKRLSAAEKYKKFHRMDPGVAAAMLGYDAINAEFHGESSSYTVILNRTKVILSDQRVAV